MAGGNGACAAAARLVLSLVGLLVVPLLVAGEDPYRFFTWTVTYGDIYPLGVKQQVR
jgi:predicted Na+-dependent transporter